MIPAQFDAAEDVFPEVVLCRSREREGTVRIGRAGGVCRISGEEFLFAAIPQIFATAMEAELFSSLVAGIARHRPGFSFEAMNIQIVKRTAQAQTRHGRGQR